LAAIHHERNDLGMFAIHAAHRRLAATLSGLSDSQARQPSLLADWSVGHVVAHIALNAEAFVNVAADLSAGRFGEMYPGGVARRNADIEALSSASAEQLRTRVEAACASFETTWSALTEEQLQGEFGLVHTGSPGAPALEVPLRRLREVEIHHADAGLATFTYEDLSDAYVDRDLPGQLLGIAERLGTSIAFVDEIGITHLCGDGALGLEPIPTTRRSLLAWSFNRISPPELPSISGWQR
jgi:maleylpyruvate isomerase